MLSKKGQRRNAPFYCKGIGSYTVAVLGNYDAPAASNLARGIREFLAFR